MLNETFECHASTSAPPDFVDLTDEIVAALERSAIAHGRVTVFSPDERCAILVNERESGLLQDLKGALSRMSNGSGAGDALVGSSSVVLPVVEGELKLGTWQRVLLVELGQPSRRAVSVQIVGETA